MKHAILLFLALGAGAGLVLALNGSFIGGSILLNLCGFALLQVDKLVKQ